MYLLSVNVGRPRYLARGDFRGLTGIFKEPVSGAVAVHPEGVAGDTVCDTQHHGGPDQAVYVYGSVDYDWWAAELGPPLAPGTLGENLTVHDLEASGFAVGDRLHVGSTVLEVTGPRIPCSTLAARMDDRTFIRRFREAERPGFYCRVLVPGVLQAGDPVRWEPYAGERITVLELFRAAYQEDFTVEALRRILAAPVAARLRLRMERRLERLLAVQRGLG